MNDWYMFIVLIHVLSAVVSIGPLFVLFAILKKIRHADPAIETAYIAIFRSIVRLIKHAGHVLVGSGIVLVYFGPWPWSTSWIVLTIGLMVVSIFFLAKGFSGTLKKFVEPGVDRLKLISKLYSSTWIYITLLVLMLALMVIKPTLW